MTTAFTPWPWTWIEQEGHELPCLVGQSGVHVCDFGNDRNYYPTEGMPPNDADARLIASAPELLAALEAALLVIEDYLEYDHNGDPWTEDARTMGEMDINDYKHDGRLESARAVIAKAMGIA